MVVMLIGLVIALWVMAALWWAARARFRELEFSADAREKELRLEVKRETARADACKRVGDEASRAEAQAREAVVQGLNEAGRWRRAAEELELRLGQLREEREHGAAFLDSMERHGVTEELVLPVFGMADDGTAWWRAVNGFVALQARIERGNALSANLSSESRHYNAGRAAALEDLREQFLQLRARGQEEASKAA
jgi:hypothetical protein